MTLIHYFVHGRGRGHASRSVPIVQCLLARGYPVVVHGGGDASDALRSLPVWLGRPPLEPGPLALARLPWRALRDVRALRRAGTELIISDGEQSVFLAARTDGLPTVAVGHDLVYTTCRLPVPVGHPRAWLERLNTMIPTRLATWRVAVHFLPVDSQCAQTLVARPDAAIAGTPSDEGFVVAYFRDGNGAGVVELLRAAGREVRWYGPGATDTAGHSLGAVPHSRFTEELGRSSAVVGSSGSNLLAECVAHAKPVLALYDQAEPEQALNAVWAASAGVAEAAPFHQVDARLVTRFLARVDRHEFARVSLTELPAVSGVVRKIVDQITLGC